MLFEITEIIVNIHEALLLYMLLVRKLKIDKYTRILALLFTLIMGGITTVLKKLGVNVVAVFAITLFVHEAYTFIFFKGNFRERVLWGASVMLVLLITNSITYASFVLLQPGENLLLYGRARFFMLISYMVLNVPLVVGLSRFREKDRVMPLYISLITVALCVVGGLALYILLGMTDVFTAGNAAAIKGVSLAFVIVTLIITILVLLDGICRSLKKQLNAQMQVAAMKNRAEHEQHIIAMAQTFREIKHDYANHISVITAFVKKGDMEGLSRYLEDYNDKYDVDYFYATGNVALDSILTSKALECRHKGINFTAQVHITDMPPLSDMELTCLFGNLLDNAIEAQESVEGEKYVRLEIVTRNRQFIVRLTNSSSGRYEFDDESLVTLKQDKLSHGFGLKMIREIVEKYNGIFELHPESDCFRAELLLRIADKLKS